MFHSFTHTLHTRARVHKIADIEKIGTAIVMRVIFQIPYFFFKSFSNN